MTCANAEKEKKNVPAFSSWNFAETWQLMVDYIIFSGITPVVSNMVEKRAKVYYVNSNPYYRVTDCDNLLILFLLEAMS